MSAGASEPTGLRHRLRDAREFLARRRDVSPAPFDEALDLATWNTHARVRQYYEQCWRDYRAIWLSPRTRAMHFGWWDDGVVTHEESLLEMNRQIAARLALGRRGEATGSPAVGLDAGCGVGGTSIWFSKEYHCSMVGITLVPDQVERAKRYAVEHDVADRVDFSVGDYVCTGFPDASFDFVVAVESVCHAPDKRAFLVEARRLLRPGGRLLVEDWWRTARPIDDDALMRSWLRRWAIPDLVCADDFARWAADLGFEAVKFEPIERQVERSLKRLHRIAWWTLPVVHLLRRIGVWHQHQVEDARASIAQYRAFRCGLWLPGIIEARLPE